MDATLTVPIQMTADGVLRIGGTRVTLDTIVTAFANGATPEEIALRYPSLTLADIYVTISYYLQHQTDVQYYLQQRQQTAAAVRAESEARSSPNGIRSRLLARRALWEA